ncbi:hypothetical protein CSB45_05410 [candidate division KSB3 bacterium]|uniref:Uncharacterized protein n=1 Tax=candidate division KSB3 bacterium TaxID=2044937 RepID=A0A2G6E7T1_9BACT|nr:MAG: hypothetical protein CSB45_05410 [candidate division KSB3 bacterium]PIE30485.1 MAG: hypothetical protein CSA57_04175 [candidate division KSB3 bacterium]
MRLDLHLRLSYISLRRNSGEQGLWVALFFSSVVLLTESLVAAYDAREPEKIRAAFFGICSKEEAGERFALLQRNGFNAALVNDSGYAVKAQLWRQLAKTAADYDIRLFPICSFAGTAEIEALRGSFTPYVNRDGTIFPSTPCPLDAEYWEESLAERFSQFADLSRLVPLAGMLFDTEMYGSELAVYDDVCFCESCWHEFLQTLALSEPSLARQLETAHGANAAQQFRDLIRYGLTQRYMRFQEEQLEEFVSRLEAHIHHHHPELPLGFLAYVDNWFYRALIRGLGRPSQPVLVFSETAYVRGYSSLLLQEQAEILSLRSGNALNGRQQPIARYIPGLWQSRFFPEDLARQVYDVALHSDGYWIFSADSLWSETDRSGHYALHGPREQYWAAFRTANTALEEFARTHELSRSSLAAVHIGSTFNETQQTLLTHASLDGFLKKLAMQQDPERVHTQVECRSTALFHCLNVSEQGRVQISAISDHGVVERVAYDLFDRQGVCRTSGELQNGAQTARLDGTDIPAGRFSLRLDSGAGASRVSFEGIPCLLEASNSFPFRSFGQVQPYAVFIPDGKTRLKLRAFSHDARQRVDILIQAPDGWTDSLQDIRDFTEFHIPPVGVPQTSALTKRFPQEWTFLIHSTTTPDPDILLYFYDEPFPCLILN